MPAVRIVSTTNEGVLVSDPCGAGLKLVRWGEIIAADVFKRDLFTTDLLCLHIWRSDDEDPFEFDKDDAAWPALWTALEQNLIGIVSRSEWFPRVAFPAFAANRLRVFTARGG